MIRDFEAFLKIEKRVAQNTMIRYMKCLKKVVNLAIANGWITVNPFAGIKFSEKKVVKDFLTIEEVNTIRTKEFDIERLNIVKDIFIFCCYTGLAFIDVYNLKSEHITEDAHSRKWIHKQRQKTEVEFFVPLFEYPLQLIEKYRNHPMCRANKMVFPVYANQKMNSYLKEIADLCGIKKHLTMHTARYTFATTITLANDVKLENVSKMLGHTNTRMTLHYAHIMNESLAQEMNKVAAIMGE
ncbi:MAG: site-specific integrase [Alistipes sp.]|nr:site-specific integrase [Alistipes sp.]